MRTFATLQSRISPSSAWQCVMLSGAFLAGTLLCGRFSRGAVSIATGRISNNLHVATTARAHNHAPTQHCEKAGAAPPGRPNAASASHARLAGERQAQSRFGRVGCQLAFASMPPTPASSRFCSEVSTETGTKVEGMGADQRVYGDYGPGQARDVLSQLLQGSGYNVLLAGDIGQGAPREIVLSPRQSGPPRRTRRHESPAAGSGRRHSRAAGRAAAAQLQFSLLRRKTPVVRASAPMAPSALRSR